jgi:hypothetical protein
MDGLLTDKNTSSYLTFVACNFLGRTWILDKSPEQPRTTSRVLADIRRQGSDLNQMKHIQSIQDGSIVFSCATQAEADFTNGHKGGIPAPLSRWQFAKTIVSERRSAGCGHLLQFPFTINDWR